MRLDLIAVAAGLRVPALAATDYTAPLKITAVGVYDTVSSLGLPHLDSSGDAVFDFSICDTILNDDVLHGFHALAADETRDLFSPTFWAARSNVSQQIFRTPAPTSGAAIPSAACQTPHSNGCSPTCRAPGWRSAERRSGRRWRRTRSIWRATTP